MTPFEYLLPLVSVLVGLAVADLAVSLHRLLRARRRVRWDGLALAAALLAVLAVLEVWWTFYGAQEADFYTTLAGFLPLAAQLILLFLLNAAALPDDVPPKGLDLRVFYMDNSPYFWSLYAAYVLFVMIQKISAQVLNGAPDGLNLLGAALTIGPNVVLVISFIALARSQRRWLHWLVVSVWLAIFLTSWWGLRLETP